MPEMRIADFLRHDAQAYGVPGAPSIERILEVCVEAANWIDKLENRVTELDSDLSAWGDVASSPGAVEDMARDNYRLESTYSQVSKALCGKENATLDEVLKTVDQLKNELKMARAEREDKIKNHIDFVTRLAQAERERDALMEYAKGCCETCAFVGDCAKHDPDPTSTGVWWYGDCEEWQWRGVCKENSKEEQQ